MRRRIFRSVLLRSCLRPPVPIRTLSRVVFWTYGGAVGACGMGRFSRANVASPRARSPGAVVVDPTPVPIRGCALLCIPAHHLASVFSHIHLLTTVRSSYQPVATPTMETLSSPAERTPMSTCGGATTVSAPAPSMDTMDPCGRRTRTPTRRC